MTATEQAICKALKLTGADTAIATRVEREMARNGLDFSECSQRAFDRAAREAYDSLIAPDTSTR